MVEEYCMLMLVFHWNYHILQDDIYLDDVLKHRMYHSRENMQHMDILFDKVVVDFEVNDLELNHEMTMHQFRRDYYQEKQCVHRMDHMLKEK
jgi:hypothetical protein